jgi:AcrR family transcriptional regulator
MATAPVPRGERVRDAERTRAELLAVATEVFSEQGLSGARVDEIAERTRTTKRMIYYYFGSKEQLYRAVLEEAYRGIRRAEQSIATRDADPVDAVREVAETTFDHHHAHPAFIRLVSIENIHRAEHLKQVGSLRELATPAVSLLEEILERGRASGDFRADVDALDVHMVISSYCVFQVANRSTWQYLFGRDMKAAEVRARHRAIIGDVVVGWLTGI